MFIYILSLLLLCIQPLNGQTVDANGVTLTQKWEHMERLMLEEGNLKIAISQCNTFLGDSKGPTTGHQTTAEWVRLVFHDAVTANIAAGTGGLDASIGFESDRVENVGISFVNDTLVAFNRVYSVMTSMSDIIGLGLMLSLIVCDPNQTNQRLLKLRVGRKDATAAGPFGVPEPHDSLATMLADFSRAGFSQSEAITSVTCGHSLGSVNTIDFPDIIPASAITPDNTHGTVPFDSTKAVFDNRQVTDYLDGVGTKGGPLVVGNNVTTRSDLRLFSSDNNSTIKSLRSASTFQDKCFTVFEKMMNTVPSGTVLSDIVKPRPWSMEFSYLDLYPDGVVSYEGVFKGLSKTQNLPDSATYVYTTQGGGNTGSKTTLGEGYGFSLGFGNTKRYPFKDNITTPTTTGILVQNSYSAPLDLNLFVVKSQSFWVNGFSQLLIRVAVKSSLATTTSVLTTTVYYPVAQQGSVAPKIAQVSVNLSYKKTSGQYKIFQAVVGFTAGERSGGDSYVDVKFGSLVSLKIWTSRFDSCEVATPFNC